VLSVAKEVIMKSVVLSEVVRVDASSAGSAGTRWGRFALTLALGLPLLMLVIHQLDPAAPLAFIVLPALAGGILPVLAAVPGKFEVTTRFEAQHLVRTLDQTLAALGYENVERQPGAVRYRTRPGRWLGKEVAVIVRERTIELVGPVPTLRALQAQLAF
jgi:hypothetical protein